VPNAIRWVDEAVKLAAAQDESADENFVRKHILADTAWLEEQGEEHTLAWERASCRIFGDPPGAYGAGVGVNWSNQANWVAHLHYAWKIGREEATSDTDRSGRFWFQLYKFF